MSLNSTPVTQADIEQLQLGIQFFENATEATNEANAINAGTTTVYDYAVQLLATQISVSQVAVADSALMEGATVAAGTVPYAPNTLGRFTTQFLPSQVAYGVAHGFNPTVFAAQSLGLALANQPGFNSNFAGLSASQFVASVANIAGINVNAITGWLQYWTSFYTANGTPNGLTVTQAAYGATMGDAIGNALLIKPTLGPANQPAGLPAPPQGPPTFTTLQNQVYNALIANAEGSYAAGVALGSLPIHTPLQGEAGNVTSGVFLTPGVDSPTSGFSTSPSGTPLLNGFTAKTAGQVFNALPVASSAGLTVNTLNIADNLQDTKLDGTLNFVAVNNFGGLTNPPFATNVTMNGLSTAVITNTINFPTSGLVVAGFEGSATSFITGLTTVNDASSVNLVQVGGNGLGLKTALTNVNISNYGGPTFAFGPEGSASVFDGIIAASVGAAANTINIGITGPLGGTSDAATFSATAAAEIRIANDTGNSGTTATPNLSYGSWAIKTDSNAFLQLAQGGVGAAANLKLTSPAATTVAVGQAAAGDWQNLAKLDLSATAGTAIITGASAGLLTSNAFATLADPGWLLGSLNGLLDDTGTGGIFNLAAVMLGTGKDVVDVSSGTAAQIGGLVTTGAVVPGNEIIVQDSVATTITNTTFKNIAGFEVLGIGGPTMAQGAAGAISMANLPGTIDTILYQTTANGSVFINNQTAAVTVNVEDNSTAGQNLTVGAVGPAPGLMDSLTVDIGNPLHGTFLANGSGNAAGAGNLGLITATGDEIFALNALSIAGVMDTTGLVTLTPTLGGNEMVTLGGTGNDFVGGNTLLGAMVDTTTTGVLDLNNLTITIKDASGFTTFQDDTTPPSLLNFVTGTPGFSPSISYATNAVTIDATTSGGLIMKGGDANFIPAATVAASAGDVITGAASPIGDTIGTNTIGNILIGSIGNDTITSKSPTLPDFIVTDGGADTITLAAGHTGVDHVGFYTGDGLSAIGTPLSVAGAISIDGPSTFEEANPGWFGTPAGSVSLRIDTTFPSTGTSLSESTLTGYVTGQDILDFSGKAFGVGGAIHGLTADNGAAGLQNVSAIPTPPTPDGVPVIPVQVAPGGTIAGTAAAPNDFIVLSQGSFLNANAVAQALENPTGSYNIFHSPLSGGEVNYDFLLAYQGTDGNAHIADLNILSTGAGGDTQTQAGHATSDLNISVSDMVTLVGVNLTQLVSGISHVHLVA